MLLKRLLFVTVIICAFSNTAFAGEGSSPAKQVEQNGAKFLMNTPAPYGWRMMYGPVGNYVGKKVVRLQTNQRNGYMLFSCDQAGNAEMALAVAGFAGKQDQPEEVSAYTAGKLFSLPMKIGSAKGLGGVESILYLNGEDVVRLLNALSSVGESGEAISLSVGTGNLKRTFKAPSISPRGIGVMGASLCTGWHNQKVQKDEKNFLSSQLLH